MVIVRSPGRRIGLFGIHIWAGVFVVLTAGAVRSSNSTLPAPRQIQESRLVAVVADMHMGPGRDERGEWWPVEDFRWADEFALFLDALDAEGGGETDLVLNGDTFDLTRLGDAGCAYDDLALGCTEPEALARLDRVLAAHADVIDTLAAFAASGANRVILVPGEHDAALLLPGGGATSRRARRSARRMAAPRWRRRASGSRTTDRSTSSTDTRSAGGRTGSRTWPEPFVERDGRRHLARPERARAVDGVLRRARGALFRSSTTSPTRAPG